jgi:hypothetical protein
MPAQPSSSICHKHPHNILLPMLKEHLADVIDELVSVSNKRKINMMIEKFDDESTKAHRLMQQTEHDRITVQKDCFNVICDVLSGNDNGDVVGNNTNQDHQQDVEAQVVNDNVQQTSNTEMEVPCQMIYVRTMTRELNKPNLLHSPHVQMCQQPPRCCRHVVEPLLYLNVVYFTNYWVLNN